MSATTGTATVEFETADALVVINQIKVELYKNSSVDGVSRVSTTTESAAADTAQAVTGITIPADGSYYVVVTVLTSATDSTVS